MTCRVTRIHRKPNLRLLRNPSEPVEAVHLGQASETEERAGCRAAVIRVYRELRQRGLDDRASFDASVTLYRLRHPRADRRTAIDIVSEWICLELDSECELEAPH